MELEKKQENAAKRKANRNKEKRKKMNQLH
jgi:colicin import membrane protein